MWCRERLGDEGESEARGDEAGEAVGRRAHAEPQPACARDEPTGESEEREPEALGPGGAGFVLGDVVHQFERPCLLPVPAEEGGDR